MQGEWPFFDRERGKANGKLRKRDVSDHFWLQLKFDWRLKFEARIKVRRRELET